MSLIPTPVLESHVRRALEEDLYAGDPTSEATIAAGTAMTASIHARAAGILAGSQAAAMAFRLVDPALDVSAKAADGDAVAPGACILTLSGDARSIVMAERTALNFVTHLSGVASLTARYVEAVAGAGAAIAPTRKTLPGLRALQKAAVEAGGGQAHRYSLGDALMIKDNHVAAAGGVALALQRARALSGHMRVVSLEVDTLDQMRETLAAPPDVFVLDNFSLDALREAVALNEGRAVLEASGGVSLETVKSIADTGVDVISVGALTHSAPALDFGLDAA